MSAVDDEGEISTDAEGLRDRVETARFRQRPHEIRDGVPSGELTESSVNEDDRGDEEQVKTPTAASPLRKTPSYVDLYNEELIENNRRCYMQ